MTLRCFFSVSLLCLGVCLSSSALAAGTTHTNSLGMEFVLIPAGSFTMGADDNFEHATPDESFQHRVSISKSFYLGKYEVTQSQWTAVMKENPSNFKGKNKPVEQVSWEDAQEFIKRLNAKEGHTRYRLPTEAEWEYAARAGTGSTYFFGDDGDSLVQYAWYEDNAHGETHPVGHKQPNAWGLHDMYGNVWEWVQDWYGENYYSNSPATDPTGPTSGESRVLRGGSWRSFNVSCRSASRDFYAPAPRHIGLGIRLALSVE